MAIEQADPVPAVAALGLRDDAPREVVKAIVKAAQDAGPSDPAAVEKALSAFSLATLLKPGATVATLAAGIAGLVRSGSWPKIVDAPK
jgi:hypothetical protein